MSMEIPPATGRQVVPEPMTGSPYVGRRIKLARELRAVTQAKLSQATGIPQTVISKLEHGIVSSIEPAKLLSIAKALNMPPKFFEIAHPVFPTKNISFRKSSSMPQARVNQVAAVTNILAPAIRYSLMDRVRLQPHHNISDLFAFGTRVDALGRNGVTAGDLAGEVRRIAGIRRGPIHNLSGLIEDFGVIIVKVDLAGAIGYSEHQVDGLQLSDHGDPPIIFINSQQPADRYRLTLAHEFGHLLMKHTACADDEALAYDFASELLMPQEEIRRNLALSSLREFFAMKPFWRVSVKALIRRAYKLNMIDDRKYKSFMVMYNRYGWNKGEPGPLEEETPVLMEKLFSFYTVQMKYTRDDLANVLGIGEEDMQLWLGKWLPEKPPLTYISTR